MGKWSSQQQTPFPVAYILLVDVREKDTLLSVLFKVEGILPKFSLNQTTRTENKGINNFIMTMKKTVRFSGKGRHPPSQAVTHML